MRFGLLKWGGVRVFESAAKWVNKCGFAMVFFKVGVWCGRKGEKAENEGVCGGFLRFFVGFVGGFKGGVQPV